MTTVVRPSLAQAIRSVYAQRFTGRIQILVGIDRWEGERAVLDGLLAECPSHVAVTEVDLATRPRSDMAAFIPALSGRAQDHSQLRGEQPLCDLSRRRQLVHAGPPGNDAGGGERGKDGRSRCVISSTSARRRSPVPGHLGSPWGLTAASTRKRKAASSTPIASSSTNWHATMYFRNGR